MSIYSWMIVYLVKPLFSLLFILKLFKFLSLINFFSPHTFLYKITGFNLYIPSTYLKSTSTKNKLHLHLILNKSILN